MAVTGGQRLRQQVRQIAPVVHERLVRAIQVSALELDRAMKVSIQHGPKSGRLYRRGAIKRTSSRGLRGLKLRRAAGSQKLVVGGTFHRASAPGEAPATDTGRLVSSIAPRFDEGGMVATIGVHDVSRVKYALYLEYGTRRMAARPYVRPAYEKYKATIAERLHKALVDGLRTGRAA